MNIIPVGGKIEIIAGRNFRIGRSSGNTNINIYPGTIMYAASQGSNKAMFSIKESKVTNIDDSIILSRRRLVVSNGAQIKRSYLYVSYADTDTNNYLRITDKGTNVSGAIVSKGRSNPSLIIENRAVIRGIIYQYADTKRGRVKLRGDPIIYGSVLARQFQRGRIREASIIYSLDDVLNSLPQGFGNYVVLAPYQWDDH